MDFERTSPQSVESERLLLGGLILREDKIAIVSELVRPEDFFDARHQALYELLLSMSSQNMRIDTQTVSNQVIREDQADRYGSVAYVADLPNQVPSTSNLEEYATMVKEMSVLRGVITLGRRAVDDAYSIPKDVGSLLTEVLNGVTKLSLGGARGGTWSQISLVADEEMQRIERLSETTGSTTGVTTGFSGLDAKLAGLQDSDLLILAARPAMGKTALAVNIAQNVALLGGRAVGIFSLEMSRGQLVTRMLCCEGLVDAGRVRTGQLDTDDWQRLGEADTRLRATKVFIDDTPGLSIGDLRNRARRLHAEHAPIGVLVIDYLQLMKGEDPRAPREQQISSISRGLKGLAKELNCPVLALSQLNRGVESRQDKRPLVSDLRESGAIEQDADIIMFIYRDEYYNPESADKGLAEVIIAKQRNGPTGTVKLAFLGQYSRFDNVVEEDGLL